MWWNKKNNIPFTTLLQEHMCGNVLCVSAKQQQVNVKVFLRLTFQAVLIVWLG